MKESENYLMERAWRSQELRDFFLLLLRICIASAHAQDPVAASSGTLTLPCRRWAPACPLWTLLFREQRSRSRATRLVEWLVSNPQALPTSQLRNTEGK